MTDSEDDYEKVVNKFCTYEKNKILTLNEDSNIPDSPDFNIFDDVPKKKKVTEKNLPKAVKKVTKLNETTEPVIEILDKSPNSSTIIIDDDIASNSNVNDSVITLDSDETVNCSSILNEIDDLLSPKRGRGRGRRKRKPTRKSNVSKKQKEVTNSEIINDTEDEINYEISVKVKWKSQAFERFPIKRFDNLSVIFEHFSKLENVPESRLLFSINDQIIKKDDTPYSLNLTCVSIIEGGIIDESITCTAPDSVNKEKNSNKIQLKVLFANRKAPFTVSIKINEKMSVLMWQCAGELKLPLNKLKFYFDGDVIQNNDTPLELGLEGGECIDCKKQ